MCRSFNGIQAAYSYVLRCFAYVAYLELERVLGHTGKEVTEIQRKLHCEELHDRHHKMVDSRRMAYIVHLPCVRCEMHKKFWPENLKKIDHLGDRDVDCRIILKGIVAYLLKAKL